MVVVETPARLRTTDRPSPGAPQAWGPAAREERSTVARLLPGGTSVVCAANPPALRISARRFGEATKSRSLQAWQSHPNDLLSI